MTRPLGGLSALVSILLTLTSPTDALGQGSPPPAGSSQERSEGEAPAAGSLSAAEREAIRQEIRLQLEAELQEKLDAAKEEMRDEVRAAVVTAGAAQEWDDEWDEIRPELSLFEVNGYFRTRMDVFYKFDLGMDPDPAGFDIFPADPHNRNNHTVAGANLRLRIDPTLNVSEEVRLRAQVDVFDNLIFGSTPRGGFSGGIGNERYPWVIGSPGQEAPRFGVNSIADSITAKRVWAEIRTPLGELRFGRMAEQFGMGMNLNDGNCIDCDHGNTVDRILFATKIANHVIMPALDFLSEGPTSADPFTQYPTAQPFDRTQSDDARQWVLSILRRDSDDEIRKLRAAGKETIINYGLHLAYRTQTWDAPALETSGPGNGNAGGGSTQVGVGGTTGGSFVPRDAWSLTPDVWFRLLYKKYRLELEFVTVQGRIGNRALDPGDRDDASENQSLTLAQYGAVMQNEVKLSDDKLSLGLELGFASGDSAPGFGNFPGRADPNSPNSPFPQRGDWEGAQFNCFQPRCADRTINNFRFNRDYRMDLILFREILGGVTDAAYVRPSLRYDITQGLDVNLAFIYSQVADTGTTPTGNRPLGFEIDAGINYISDDGFIASVAYGVLFPLSGLDQLSRASGGAVSAESAQAVRAFFGVVY